jgi:hypothetical protein
MNREFYDISPTMNTDQNSDTRLGHQHVPDHIKYVSGPETLTVHRDSEDTQIIYIFGEVHGFEDSCPGLAPETYNIIDFLTHTLQTTQVPIDFYLEASLKNIKGERYEC